MSFLPGKVDAKLVFGKKPRTWMQDFIKKSLIAIYDRTTFRARGRLGRTQTIGLKNDDNVTKWDAFYITFVSSSLTRDQ